MKYVTYLTEYSGSKLPRYYIGSTSIEKALSGNYFGSITSKKWKNIFKEELRENNHLFTIQILDVYKSRKEAFEGELYLHIKNDVVRSKDYFNESLASPRGCFGMDVSSQNNPMYGRSLYSIWLNKFGKEIADIKDAEWKESQSKSSTGKKGKALSKESLDKMVKTRKEKNNYIAWNKGKTGFITSEETKRKMSEKRKGTRKGDKNPMFGKIWITDGRINGLIENKDELPEGWYFGQTKKSFNN